MDTAAPDHTWRPRDVGGDSFPVTQHGLSHGLLASLNRRRTPPPHHFVSICESGNWAQLRGRAEKEARQGRGSDREVTASWFQSPRPVIFQGLTSASELPFPLSSSCWISLTVTQKVLITTGVQTKMPTCECTSISLI